jgi:hypothetical protein
MSVVHAEPNLVLETRIDCLNVGYGADGGELAGFLGADDAFTFFCRNGVTQNARQERASVYQFFLETLAPRSSYLGVPDQV